MKRTCDSPIAPTLLPLCFAGAAQRVFFYPRLFCEAADPFFALQQRAKGTDNPKPQVQSIHNCDSVSVPSAGRSFGTESFFILLRTALKDRPKGPPTANHQPPSTANRNQPPTTNRRQPPVATNRQPLPTATNHQPPTTTNRHQPPAANCQPPIATDRQPPTATNYG